MNHFSAIKALLACMAVLFGVIAALVAATLLSPPTADPTTRYRNGGAAFLGAVTVTILLLTAVGLL